jgi:hypothetical protein
MAGIPLTPTEVARKTQEIRSKFPDVDSVLLDAVEPLMKRAAIESLYLEALDGIAEESGLVAVSPKDPTRQRPLPVSQELTRHGASYTNIMDKIIRHLKPQAEIDEEELADYE